MRKDPSLLIMSRDRVSAAFRLQARDAAERICSFGNNIDINARLFQILQQYLAKLITFAQQIVSDPRNS